MLTLTIGDCDAYYSMPAKSGGYFNSKYVVHIDLCQDYDYKDPKWYLKDPENTRLIHWAIVDVKSEIYKKFFNKDSFPEERPYLQLEVLEWLVNNVNPDNYHFLDVYHTDRFQSSSPFTYMDFPIQFKKLRDARAFIKEFLPKGTKLITHRKK